MSDAVCEFCGNPATPGAPDVLYAISGWEELRSQGGANMVHLRHRLGPVAHTKCVDEAKGRRVERQKVEGKKLDLGKVYRGVVKQ